MIIHRYSSGDPRIVRYYGGHGFGGRGFGSIFARLFSKIASKTAARAAMLVAKKVGSTLVKAGVKKAAPIAKRTIKSVVRTGMKKAVPIAKKMVKNGVKRAAEEAQSAIANKVRKVEEAAIRKGVSPKLAHMVSSFVEDGSKQGVGSLSNLVNRNSDKIIAQAVDRVDKVVGKSKPKSGKPKSGKSKSGKVRRRKAGGRRKVRGISAYDIQNLIDSA